MHKLKKIIISFVFSLVLMSVFSLCVFASYTETEYGSSSDFRGYTYVFNKCPTYCHTFYAQEQGIVSCGFSDFAYLEVKSVSRNSDGLITHMYFEPADSYTSLYTMDYTFKHILKEYSAGSRDINFQQTIYSVYGQITYIGYNIDWKYVTIPGSLVESGEQFSYYDYFGEIKTVTFTGDGGIFGGGSANRFPGEISEQPTIDNYLPDFNDSKYNPGDLSSYLPTPPDSLDILDWLKYFIDCVKAFFNWAVDTFKAKILLLYDTLSSLFNFLKDYFTYFLDKLKESLFDLFVPSDDFVQSAIDKFSQVELSSTFLNSTVAPVVQALEQTIDRTPKKYEFSAFGADCSFDFSALQFILPVTDAIIIFFSYFFGLKHLVFSFLNLFSTIKKEGD